MEPALTLPRPTIHIVDDDDGVRRALAFALDLEGFAVETYSSGEALLLGAPPQAPGCLVLDERLPGVSGLDTLRQLRARAVALPAVFVTSHPRPGFRQAAADIGAPILEKPLEGETLIAAIHRLIDPPPSEAALPFLQALAAAFEAPPHQIHVDCAPALQLPAEDLGRVGMIAREAIANALKHAFPEGRVGGVWVSLSQAEGRVTLRIHDNGIGMPDLDHDRASGHGRIETLAEQLGGRARLGSTFFGGAEVKVIFPHRS